MLPYCLHLSDVFKEYHLYKRIHDTLIPLLNYLCLNIPISLTVGGKTYSSTDLRVMDELFESIMQKYIMSDRHSTHSLTRNSNFKLLSRDTEIWACFYSSQLEDGTSHPSLSQSLLPPPLPQILQSADVTVDIPFDLGCPANKKAPFPVSDRQAWTEEQRAKSGWAVEPLSEQDLRKTVSF